MSADRAKPRRVFVRTLNSVYELYVRRRQVRRIEGKESAQPPLYHWRLFHRVGPIVRGSPMRFWFKRSEAGRSAHVEVLTTAPVVEITITESSEEHGEEQQAHPTQLHIDDPK